MARVHRTAIKAGFIWVAFDCSTKSRITEIPRRPGGPPVPLPLRSEDHPLGFPGFEEEEKERVDRDNESCEFILAELDSHRARGGASGRETPEFQPALAPSSGEIDGGARQLDGH